MKKIIKSGVRKLQGHDFNYSGFQPGAIAHHQTLQVN